MSYGRRRACITRSMRRECQGISRELARDIRLLRGRESTHIFLSLLDTGCDLVFGSESFVLRRVDLILSEHRKGRFDTQLLDSNLT